MVLIRVDSSTVLGRAIATITNANTINRKTNSNGRNFANQFLEVSNPFKLDIFKTAVCCFLFQKNHSNNNGSSNNNQNNCGFTNKYRQFDLDYKFDIECETNIIFLKRNNDWMKIIPNLLKTKNTFIAVGYGHLIKKCGILEQLKNKGFKIEPIKIKPVAENVYKQ